MDRHELTKKDISLPSEAWVVYAVCGIEQDSCGWEGWIIESITSDENNEEIQLKCMNEQICPDCGKSLFRTDTQIKMKYSPNQNC